MVYTPHATLIHHELASRHRLGEDFDKELFRREWGGLLRTGDPFFHPALSLDYDDFVPSPEPVELVYASRPLFAKDDIRRILALKLDHIGDFVTAIPALRRLREAFPQARLSALVARQTRAFAELVPEIDEFIDFELFFTRSELGLRDLPQEAYSELRERLKPYRFDLAVDLRKAPDSRLLLRCSGARWLAGFDHQNQFPWLDIVVAWEGDPAVTRKRSHIGDDLLRLVETVIAAAEPNAGLLRPPPIDRNAVALVLYPAWGGRGDPAMAAGSLRRAD